MSGKNLKIDGKVCPNVTVIKALDTDQNKLVEFVDTSDANATSSDIITGKTAYVDGKKVIGEATAGVDTNDATAVSGDILQGKTAYAKGVKLTGSVLTYDGAFVGNTHTITATLTNVTAASGNATTIAIGETKVLTYTAADGYALPDTVTVTGATSVWNKDAGTLTLSNPTGNVTFTIAGVEAASGYNVTFAGWTVEVDYGAFVRVYDAQSATGNYTSLPSNGGTVNCTSGYLYLEGNYGDTGYNDSSIDTPTVAGGVTIESIDQTGRGNSWILFKVTGDGTVGSFYMSCFIEGTQITLADGTTKAIEDITYDDELLVWNFYAGRFDTAKPTWIKVEEVAPRYNLVKFSDGREFGTVGAGGEKGYHRVFNKEAGAFTHIGTNATPIGTTTFADDGTNPTIVSEEIIEKPVKYYNIITDKHYNIFAMVFLLRVDFQTNII